ncbi:MAG TPA: DUF1549 domain-containing protein, partial [Chthonomonadaceae bacterium]|nr:DUF1549 domain-containing protein [Chthonomonadaceae bacterium]
MELLGVVCTLAGLAALAWADPPAPQSTDLKSPAPLSAQAAEANRQFWAFLPLQHAAPPEVKHAAWVKTPIDRFLLAQMEAKGLQPNAEAERRTLIRRVTFDLIGLPPTPEEVDAFVADPAPDAYERLVDRLLANPHFGERWGRHWLDLVRYADSDGFEADRDRPNAYPYRDFIIKAFNSDMPYNRFVRWQLAGDELAPGDPNAWAATGFGTAGVHSVFTVANEGTPLEREQMRYDELDDMLATTGAAFLGLTVGCARCHDHKFDPITQEDYYGLQAIFAAIDRTDKAYDADPAVAARRAELTARRDTARTTIARALAEALAWGGNGLTGRVTDVGTLKAAMSDKA